MKPKFFSKQSDFRKWLKENHEKKTEIIVGFYKLHTQKPSMTWSQSVDEALCFGWIDSVRKSIDTDSYQNRFTPRKPNSIWSAINIKKAELLMAQGLMQPAGLESFKKRNEKKSGIYSHENEILKFTPSFEKQFKANKKAWKFFQSLAPSYKKSSNHWVMSAKLEATRIKRMQQLIKASEGGTNPFKDNKSVK